MSFGGHAFHTSRWDYDYTGTDLSKLSDKRVGIIGTGATAIQCVPRLAKSVKHLLVFQRTPSTVDVRGNRPTEPDWSAGLNDGWQRRRIENFQLLTAGGDADEDLVDDAWTSIVKKLFVMRQTAIAGMSDEERLRTVDMADFAKMEEIRARVDSIVADRCHGGGAQALVRLLLQAAVLPRRVPADVQPPQRQARRYPGQGRRADHEPAASSWTARRRARLPDFATGFEVGTDYSRRVGFDLVGRDGLTLTDKWRDGVRTFHGLTAHGFPNCFVLSIAQSGFTVNFPYLLDTQATHVAWVIAWALNNAASELEPSADAEAAWVEAVVERSTASAQRAKSCTPGYYNREGQANARTRQGSFFFGTPTEYADILEASRMNGAPEGFTIS